ncbi:zinc finger BED domain-containing protein RICESLEEPER 1-like [Carex rostrata]
MVSEALKYKDVLLWFGNSISMDVPSLEEWKEAEEMMNFLKVFLNVTKTFSTVRRPSSHSYMKEVYSIRSTLLEDDMSFNKTLQILFFDMKIRFANYWESPNLILTLACVFDPRRKLLFVDFCFQDAYGEKTDKYYERMRVVQSSLTIFYDEYERMTYNTERVTSSGSPEVERGTLEKMKFEMRFSQFQFQNRHLRPNKSELDNYLEEPLVVSDEENFDILQWWKRNSDLYPTLAKMARDFLAVSISTIASESAFIVAGRLTNKLRNSMNAETIEALVCSKDWFGSIDSSFN